MIGEGREDKKNNDLFYICSLIDCASVTHCSISITDKVFNFWMHFL